MLPPAVRMRVAIVRVRVILMSLAGIVIVSVLVCATQQAAQPADKQAQPNTKNNRP